MLLAVPISVLLVALAVAPAAMAVAHFAGSAPAGRARRSAAVLAVGAFAALGLEASALAGTPTAIPGFEVTAFSGLVLVLVLGMGATVMGFASRSLRGEPYQERFAVLGASLIGAGAVLALTTNLLVLAAAWVATSLLTVAMIRTGPATGREARSVRAHRAFTIGDLMLVVAVLSLVATTGDTSIATVGSAPGPALTAAGVLFVLAATTRSASGPFVRWLPDSLAAPTPSSALLHAGVVNAGAVLVIKLAPAVAGTVPAAATALAVGGLTCVFAEAVMLTRPDVKGRLAWSTIAQMAFTMVLCGLGLTTAAALHLVAHGLYKGALFLGSGTAVRGLVRQRSAPPADRRAGARGGWITAASFALVGTAMLVTGRLAGLELTADLAVPVGLAWVAAGCASAAWLARTDTASQRVAAILTIAGMVSLFLWFTAALDEAVAPALGGVDAALSPAWVLPVLAALVLVALTRSQSPYGARLLARAWTSARVAGRPTAPKPSALPGVIAWSSERAAAGWRGTNAQPAHGSVTDMERDALLSLRDDVARAASVVAPSWPLSSTIAVNPLSGFEHRPFEAALIAGQALFGARGHLTLTEFRDQFHSGRVARDDLVAALARRIPDLSEAELEALLTDLVHGNDEPEPDRWAITIAEQFDRDHGTDFRAQLDVEISDWCAEWSVRAEPGDLWTSWRAEEAVTAGEFPSDPAGALFEGLTRLGVPDSARRGYLERHLAALPGWAAHLRWRQERFGGDIMVGHLARCVTLEACLLDGLVWYRPDADVASSAATTAERADAISRHIGEHAGRAHITAALALLPDPARSMVWLDAYESAIHDSFLQSVRRTTPPSDGAQVPDRRAQAQVVCCIDVRSEGLRRHLEAVGDYETFGYAGFFGLAARIEPLTGGAATEQYPVLLQATTELREVAVDGHRRDAERAVEQQRVAAGLDDAWRAAKYHPIAPLALAEGAGWLAGPTAALRTCMPRFSAWIADRLPQDRPLSAPTTYERSHLDVATQAATVAAVLRLGLGSRMAPLVVLCGHHARVDNNPFESGLACGACGGNSGAPNARAVAAMANDPEVRAALAVTDTAIPADTWFVAAVHDTTTDRVTLLDVDRVSPTHRGAIAQLCSDLDRAGRGAALERAHTLPDDRHPESFASRSTRRLVDRTRRRGRDWAEPIAELGLAGNMAFVVGPRSMTRELDLGRRVFLHSYDDDADVDGSVLAGILTAPLVVAQWINAQYYFSTTDPEQFGAGTKAVHNVLGDVGVLSGPGGDLRRGLPLQSVRAGSRLLHEPVRLLAVVQGRLDHVDATITGSITLQQLVANEWISLVARTDPQALWQRRTATGWVTHATRPPAAGASAGASR